jgi:hypothetical protein
MEFGENDHDDDHDDDDDDDDVDVADSFDYKENIFS